MAAPIGPGDWVECLRVWPRAPDEAPTGFRVGGLYCVEAARDDGWCDVCCECCPGLTFTNIARGEWFIGCAFRPVYRPNADFIESLKQPSPERERETA